MSKEAEAHRDVVSALGGSAVLLEPPMAVAGAGFLLVFTGCCCRLHVALPLSVPGAAARGGEIDGATGYMDGLCLTQKDENAVIDKLLTHHPHSEDKIGTWMDNGSPQKTRQL